MRAVILTSLTLAVFMPAFASAQRANPLPTATEQRQTEAHAAIKDALAHAVHGPGDISLLDQAHIKLPSGTIWLPAQYADRILRAWGNSPDASTIGMLAGNNHGHDWTAVVTFTRAGLVKDDDSKDLDADQLLQQLRDDAAESNKDRIARGFPGLELTGWLQPPVYDKLTHRLVWALAVTDAGASDADATVNYNTRNLGRQGYISLNLLTSRDQFAADKPVANALLDGFSYNAGKRYQDFNASTDHVAEYGLAALIGAVAIKKLGLIALASAFVIKFAKLGLVAVLAVGAAFRRLFRRPPAAGPTA